MSVWVASLAVFALVAGGAVYDLYRTPAWMGLTPVPDANTGFHRSIVFLRGSLTRQYVAEGVAAGEIYLCDCVCE